MPRSEGVVKSPNYGTRLRIGMILAAGNYCAEPDALAVLPEGVSIHTTRLALDGTEPVGSTPQEFARVIRDEMTRLAPVLKKLGSQQ